MSPDSSSEQSLASFLEKKRISAIHAFRTVGGWIGFNNAFKIWDEEAGLPGRGKHTTIASLKVVATWLGLFGTASMVKFVKERKTHGTKHTTRGIFNAVVDQVVGRIVRTFVRATALTLLAGMLVGGSGLMRTGLTVLAFGVAGAAYKGGREIVRNRKTYGKSWKDSILSWKLLLDMTVNFVKSAIFGSLGAWFIHTELASEIAQPLKGVAIPVKNTLVSATSSLMRTFNLSAPKIPKLPKLPSIPNPAPQPPAPPKPSP